MPLLPTGTESVVRQHPYDKFSLALFGGADPDSSDAARQPGWFKELHNWRFETPGTPVTRTGIKQFSFRDRTPPDPENHTADAGPIVPLKCCEYTVWHTGGDTGSPQSGVQKEYRYDVTLIYEKDQHIFKLRLLDKRLRDGSGLLIALPITFTPPVPYVDPTGWVHQFGDNLIVSIFDVTTCMAWPKTWPPTNDWNVEILGKDVCPTPTKYDFPKSLTGDILLFGVHRNPQDSDFWEMQYDSISDTDPTKPILRIPLNADYVLAGWTFDGGAPTGDSLTIVQQGLIPRWKLAVKNITQAGGVSSTHNLQHRGYFYRFVQVRTIKDAEGSPIKLRSNASTDFFVPAVNYSPFFWSMLGEGTPPGYPYLIRPDQNQDQWRTDVDWGHVNVHDSVGSSSDPTQPLKVPSANAFTTLQNKWRAYFPNDPVAGGPLFWAAAWLGWSKADIPHATLFDRQPPWQTDVSAEELTSAPQAIFDWNDFPGLDATDVIEVYRTAYEDVDPVKRPVTTPLFKPHVYGLVGTIENGQVFTDTTKIPDFGADPSQYDGYLRGQFSGDVIYDYGQSPAVILGNIRADYRLLTPTTVIQAFLYVAESDGFIPYQDVLTPDPGHTVPPSGDQYNYWQFFYAYEDRSGYRSAAVPIAIDLHGGGAVNNNGAIAFTFPFGYDPNVKDIILYSSIWDVNSQFPTGHRVFYRLAVVQSEPGTFIFDAGTPGGFRNGPDLGAGILTGDSPKFYEPPAIIYSLPDSPWDWPQRQIEKHHSSAPVRCLKEMMGELAVVTDESFTLTLLRAAVPRSERNTADLGCISKHAAAKVNDAEVILTQHGLYFLVPSRPEALESQMDIDVLPRLIEQIPQLLGLANLRGASMGYMARRKELFFHVPSSRDKWPLVNNYPNPKALAHRTFIFNFTGGLRKMENYTFDISPDFEIKNLASDDTRPITVPSVDFTTFNPAKVLFSPGMDGTLYCSYMAPDGTLITIDCDDPDSDYPGTAYGTLALGLLDPQGQKQIVGTEVLMQARGQVEIMSGPPKINGGWDAIRGDISDRARIANFLKIRTDTPRAYYRPATDDATNTKGSAVMVRLRTQPDDKGRHRVELRAITVTYDSKHQHT